MTERVAEPTPVALSTPAALFDERVMQAGIAVEISGGPTCSSKLSN
jgi:hypothetical protein